jgi:hypothetical protein
LEAPGCAAAYGSVLQYPPKGHSGDSEALAWHMGDNANWRPPRPQCDSVSAIWSHTPPDDAIRSSSQPESTPSSASFLKSAHFQPAVRSGPRLRVCRRPTRRCQCAGCPSAARKWRGMRPSESILTINRTVTTRRADFAVHLTRRHRRLGAPVLMLVHELEECRITCDHRRSLY